ncbi:hypothetical protein HK102_004209, partial [Quaeritorhiza haematococci]
MSTSDPTTWRCIQWTLSPSSSNVAPFSRDPATGLIRCLSFNNRDCTWSPSLGSCASILASSPSAGVSVCGEMHRQNFGGTGLDDPSHWCVVVDSQIPRFQAAPPALPPVPNSVSPVPSPATPAQPDPTQAVRNSTATAPVAEGTATAVVTGAGNSTATQTPLPTGQVVSQRPAPSNSNLRNTPTTTADADVSIQASSSSETSSPPTVIIAASAFVVIATTVFIIFVVYLVRQRRRRKEGITITSEKTENIPGDAEVSGKKQQLAGTRDWDRLDEDEDDDEDDESFPSSPVVVGAEGDQATVILQPRASISSSFVVGDRDAAVIPDVSMLSSGAFIMGRLGSRPPSYPASAVSVRHTLHHGEQQQQQQQQMELVGASTTTSTTSSGMIVKIEVLDQGDESVERMSGGGTGDVHLLPAVPTTRLFPPKTMMDGELTRHSDVAF